MTSDNELKPVILIDASIYIFQYYFSLPDHWFSEKEQWPTAAVYGYTAFLIRLLKEQQPQRIAACFDESLDQCFRNEIYPAYKSSRALPDDALAFQLKACRRVTEYLGIACFSSQRYEADDLLGSLYRQCQKSRRPVAILTRDKDLGQLLKRPQDFLWDYAKQRRDYKDDLFIRFGVSTEQLVDYLALVGDPVDDIPGVPGIGMKTAQQLLSYFPTIDQLLSELSHFPDSMVPPSLSKVRGAKRIISNIRQYHEQITMARQLATIEIHLPLVQSVNDLNKTAIDDRALGAFCEEMGFPTLFKAASTL